MAIDIHSQKLHTDAYKKAFPLFQEANDLLANKKCDSETAFKQIMEAGEQGYRFFHDADHFFQIADKKEITNWLDAVRFRAGMNHDVVYHHVDVKGENATGFTPAIEAIVEKYTERPGNSIFLKNAKALPGNDPLLNATLNLFKPITNDKEKDAKVSLPGSKLDPFNGQNELLSALYAIEQARELGIPDKYILAELVHIRGTVPFGPPHVFTELEKRLVSVNSMLPKGQQLSKTEMGRIMQSAADMANQDVINFRESFSDKFMPNAYLLAVESVFGSIDNMNKPVYFMQAVLGQGKFLQFVGDGSAKGEKAVFHRYRDSPNQNVLASWEAKAQQNIGSLVEFQYASAAAVSLVTALHMTRHGKKSSVDTELPIMFDWEQNLKPSKKGALSEEGKIALNFAKGNGVPEDAGAYATNNMAAYLLESLGSDGIKTLGMLAYNTGILPQAGDGHRIPDKPGIANEKRAGAFLAEAQKIFEHYQIDFSAVRKTLEPLLLDPVQAEKKHDKPNKEGLSFNARKTWRGIDQQIKDKKKNLLDLGVDPIKPTTAITLPETLTSRVALDTAHGPSRKI